METETAAVAGGWDGLRAFRVVRKEPGSSVITPCYLRPADDGPIPSFRPGPAEQYDSAGFLDAESVLGAGPSADSDFYLRGLHAGLARAGVPRDRIHFEFFGPQSAITA